MRIWHSSYWQLRSPTGSVPKAYDSFPGIWNKSCWIRANVNVGHQFDTAGGPRGWGGDDGVTRGCAGNRVRMLSEEMLRVSMVWL